MALSAHALLHLNAVEADVLEMQSLPLAEQKRRAQCYNVHPDDIVVHLQNVLDRIASVRVLNIEPIGNTADFAMEVEFQPQGVVRPAP